jgi:hypothetical protein
VKRVFVAEELIDSVVKQARHGKVKTVLIKVARVYGIVPLLVVLLMGYVTLDVKIPMRNVVFQNNFKKRG